MTETKYIGLAIGGPCDSALLEGLLPSLCVPVDEGDGWWAALYEFEDGRWMYRGGRAKRPYPSPVAA